MYLFFLHGSLLFVTYTIIQGIISSEMLDYISVHFFFFSILYTVRLQHVCLFKWLDKGQKQERDIVVSWKIF